MFNITRFILTPITGETSWNEAREEERRRKVGKSLNVNLASSH